jgi:hypothetical protein
MLSNLLSLFGRKTILQRIGLPPFVREVAVMAVAGAVTTAAVTACAEGVDKVYPFKRIDIVRDDEFLCAKVRLGVFKSESFKVSLTEDEPLACLMAVLAANGYDSSSVSEIRMRVPPFPKFVCACHTWHNNNST